MEKKIPEPCGQMRRLFVARAALTGDCREDEEPFSDEVVIGVFVDKQSALGVAERWLNDYFGDLATWHTDENDTNIKMWKKSDELDDNKVAKREVIIEIEDCTGSGVVIVFDSFDINMEYKKKFGSVEEYREEYEKELGVLKRRGDEMEKEIMLQLANEKKEEEEETRTRFF